MIFDKLQAALDFCGLFDLEWILVYIIQFLCTAGKKECFAAEKKNLQILINLPEFSEVLTDILTQVLIKDKEIQILRTELPENCVF